MAWAMPGRREPSAARRWAAMRWAGSSRTARVAARIEPGERSSAPSVMATPAALETGCVHRLVGGDRYDDHRQPVPEGGADRAVAAVRDDGRAVGEDGVLGDPRHDVHVGWERVRQGRPAVVTTSSSGSYAKPSMIAPSSSGLLYTVPSVA